MRPNIGFQVQEVKGPPDVAEPPRPGYGRPSSGLKERYGQEETTVRSERFRRNGREIKETAVLSTERKPPKDLQRRHLYCFPLSDVRPGPGRSEARLRTTVGVLRTQSPVTEARRGYDWYPSHVAVFGSSRYTNCDRGTVPPSRTGSGRESRRWCTLGCLADGTHGPWPYTTNRLHYVDWETKCIRFLSRSGEEVRKGLRRRRCITPTPYPTPTGQSELVTSRRTRVTVDSYYYDLCVSSE